MGYRIFRKSYIIHTFCSLIDVSKQREPFIVVFKITHPSARKTDVPPLSRERGAKPRVLGARGESGKNANSSATLFHSHYIETNEFGFLFEWPNHVLWDYPFIKLLFGYEA